MIPSEGVGHGFQGHHPQVPIWWHDLLDEAVTLLAEALRTARAGLGITSTVVAQRVGLGPAEYGALEQGNVAMNTENVALMVSAARCMGLEELRITYIQEVQQYMKVDLSTDGLLVVFVDALRFDVPELKEQSVFVSPYQVLAHVKRFGFYETFASTQPNDKRIIELWIAAVFTLCLGRGQDYYVGLIRDDAPDVEVLEIDGATGEMSRLRLEITQHGSHSTDLVDVIGNKLRKKYQEGTVIVVLVEQAETVLISELHDFIRTNNPYNQQVFIIGGTEVPGSFKVVPWDEVTKPTDRETAWLEIVVDANNVSKGYRGYNGVVFKPPESKFLPPHPVYVKKLELLH